MTNIDLTQKLAADIREIDGDHDLSTSELAERLIDKGWVQRPQLKLAEYKTGAFVEVLKNAEWVQGRVSNITESGHVHVETERGPLTVGTPRIIRLQP